MEELTHEMWKRLEMVIVDKIGTHNSNAEIHYQNDRALGIKRLKTFFHLEGNGMISVFWEMNLGGSISFQDERNIVYKRFSVDSKVASRIHLFEATLDKRPSNFNETLKKFLDKDIYIPL
ncbi:hypothetical protein Ab1vBOLIVR5_gp04 [Agrobacterium phage OLIVR5]|uniref:Uncharacterized protein n=1 Tax=Agrobacterium phage OLIVR5 TaxID=2723773 RepID=A0A858MSC8_9CAUD|nr:hypothetical protein KNU99_gp004 [Agrobacterium phage OLIVR5]QIW87652.1 hypothetical protein Ab1vBOLIVR5_gp04 [Agrobacterium phage OLIVR5]QIW87911.1 hypothetical protein Ab1vBOLIVR6_gp04 [Agrobacterium phage OLIVR6]